MSKLLLVVTTYQAGEVHRTIVFRYLVATVTAVTSTTSQREQNTRQRSPLLIFNLQGVDRDY